MSKQHLNQVSGRKDRRLIIGTSHFVTVAHANRYYYLYYMDRDKTLKAVQRKLDGGEIHIGPPTTKTGERLYVNDEGRYIKEVKDNG